MLAAEGAQLRAGGGARARRREERAGRPRSQRARHALHAATGPRSRVDAIVS